MDTNERYVSDMDSLISELDNMESTANARITQSIKNARITQSIKDVIRESVTSEMLADYLCADNGDWLAVFEDGTYRIYSQDEVPDRHFEALATVKCPGIGNLDSTLITDQWCEMDDDIGQYVVTDERYSDRGRVIGDLADAIREACRSNVDMAYFMEELERELIANLLEA